MSSVTRFIRQIPLSTTYYDAASVANGQNAYEFVNDGNNYVGNYPPGYMMSAQAPLQAAIIAAIADGTGTTILRDMGKTIYAAWSVSAAPTVDPRTAGGTVTYAYFRQVQLLKPRAINTGPGNTGFIGGPGGNVFGVTDRSPDQYSPYLTFYIPVTVAGVALPNAVPVYAIAGGQM